MDVNNGVPNGALGEQEDNTTVMHLGIPRGAMPPRVLAPGDPWRVQVFAEIWDESEEIGWKREFRMMRGTYKGVPIGACSTGIGGPSTEIATVELAGIGVAVIVRVGTAAALYEPVEPGDMLINVAAARFCNSADAYVPREYPSVASYDVTLALIEACERLGFRYHVGIGATVSSFYAGEGNPLPDRLWQPRNPSVLPDLMSLRVLNFEMEAGILFVLGQLLNVRTGCICVAACNRVRQAGTLPPREGITRVCLAASEALSILAEWDSRRGQQGKDYLTPSIIAEVNRKVTHVPAKGK